MSLLSHLRARKGSTHRARRIGRGDASGWGGTAGRGHKGQKARKSGGIRRGFEGGQSPIILRLPKFGFSHAWARQNYALVQVSQLANLEGEVTPEILQKAGLVKASDLKRGYKIKVLQGRKTNQKIELKKTLKLKVHKLSGAARQVIEKAGAGVELIK